MYLILIIFQLLMIVCVYTGTMIIGALVTMIFFFCYTQVRSAAQNLGFNCAISFCLVIPYRESLHIDLTNDFKNIYYGTLYAYTPEVLPSAHRGTGNGIAIGLNRIMGIMSAVIATYADVRYPLLINYKSRRHADLSF